MFAQPSQTVNIYRVKLTLETQEMRVQVAVYLHPDTKKWLEGYGRRFGMTQSEVARALLEREQEVGWLRWALNAPDPAQKAHSPMRRRRNRLPRRINQRPSPR